MENNLNKIQENRKFVIQDQANSTDGVDGWWLKVKEIWANTNFFLGQKLTCAD